MAKEKILPMLNSERKELLDKIQKLKQEKDALYAATLRRVNGIVVTAPYLSTEAKTMLLESIWSEKV
jgi:hypothetical protein